MQNKKNQLAAMGEYLAEQPMCMAKRIEELEAQVEKLTNRLAWRNTGSPNGLRRFMTQKQYAAQTPGVQKWYEPIRYEVPEGWQLVPKEITPHMGHSGEVALDDDGSMQAIWTDMLAAAPSPEQLEAIQRNATKPRPTGRRITIERERGAVVYWSQCPYVGVTRLIKGAR